MSEVESDSAANRALRSITRLEVLRQLNLFETVIALYSLEAITPLEKENLDNHHNAELQRKDYLLTTVIPRRGFYKGIKVFRDALKRSEQFEILRLLNQAYEDAVNAVITNEGLDSSQGATPLDAVITINKSLNSSQGSNESLSSSGATCSSSQGINESLSSSGATCGSTYEVSGSRSDSVSSSVHAGDPDLVATANVEDALRRDELSRLASLSSSSPSSSDDDGDTVVPNSFSSALQQQPLPQQQPTLSPSGTSASHIIIHVPLAQSTTVSVTPHRDRSGHISYGSNPYKSNPKHLEQRISVTVINGNGASHEDTSVHPTGYQNGDVSTENHYRETVRRIDQITSIMKFVIVGDTATGKTSLLRRYISNKFSIACDHSTLLDVQSTELTCYNARYKLYLWDTAGQERFKALTRAYYRDAVGGFVVYDVTRKDSLEHCLQWKREINNAVQLMNGDPIPIVLVANKVDLGHLDGKQFSREHGFTHYFETSAKTGIGIKEAIHFMVKKVHQLSCVDDELESVVGTLSKNYSIKLHFNCNDQTHIRRKCCTQH